MITFINDDTKEKTTFEEVFKWVELRKNFYDLIVYNYSIDDFNNDFEIMEKELKDLKKELIEKERLEKMRLQKIETKKRQKIETKKRQKIKGIKHRFEKRKWLDDYKRNTRCEKCGEGDIACLDFHHENPEEKKFNISKGYMKRQDILMEEINKCVVLCANCHRKLHYYEP